MPAREIHRNDDPAGGKAYNRIFDRASTLCSFNGVLIFYLAYGLVHAVVARAAGPALALDEVKLNVVAQSLEGGYLRENPPLFEWLLILVQQAAGPTLLSFLIVKYALLTAAGAFIYLAGKEVAASKGWAAATALSFLGFYQIGWNYHQAFTHTTALIAATAFFWWSLLRLFRTRRVLDYALLGAAVGLGLLSKYSFAFVVAAAALALMLRAPSRPILVSPKALVSLAAALIICAPHLLWLGAENADLTATAAAHLRGEDAPFWRRATSGAAAALWSGLVFFLPLTIFIAAAFPHLLTHQKPLNNRARLARDSAVIGFALLLASIVAAGAGNVQERYVIAPLTPALFAVMALVQASAPTRSRVRVFALASGGFAALALIVRAAQTMFPGAPFCDDCRQWIPYDALYDALAPRNLDGATLVGFEDHTAGNLRRLFPQTRVLSAHLPFYTAPGGDMAAPCFFIWSNDLGPPIPERVASQLDLATTEEVVGRWRHPFKPDDWRRTTWSIASLDHAPRLEAEICRVR